MQKNSYATIAAVAVGGLLLAQRLRARRDTTVYLAHPQDELDVRLPVGTALAALAGFGVAGVLLSNYLRTGPGSMEASTVEESIELDVPVRTAYNQWTQFEDFPKFMATVEEVRQINDTHLHWRAKVGGKVKEWEAEITEQIPDKRIAWRSTDGVSNAGVVTFHKIGDDRTRVMLQMDYKPDGMDERVADTVGAVKLTAKSNLRRFKQLVEKSGTETGAWRGTVKEH